jgi:hypothetical protein
LSGSARFFDFGAHFFHLDFILAQDGANVVIDRVKIPLKSDGSRQKTGRITLLKTAFFWEFFPFLTVFDLHLDFEKRTSISLYYKDLRDFTGFPLFAILHVK